jgi:hypothetical protein
MVGFSFRQKCAGGGAAVGVAFGYSALYGCGMSRAAPSINEIADALRPLAGLGVPRVRDFPPSSNTQQPFPGRADSDVLYDDGIGHQLTVGDCRAAFWLFQRLHDFGDRD